MNTLICKNCGSSSFTKRKEKYQCNYCGSILIQQTFYSSKRIQLIVMVVVVLTILSILIYKSLISVEKKIDTIGKTKEKHTVVQQHPIKPNISPQYKPNKQFATFPLADILQKYHAQPLYKAFFISLDKEGNYVYGYSIGKGTTKEANKDAFTLCEKKRKEKHLTQICIPYLINNTIASSLTQ